MQYNSFGSVVFLRIHVVRPGESIYTIGQFYNVSPQKIIGDNELANPNQLVVGQTLVILEGTRRHAVVSGESVYTIARDYRLSMQDIINANPSLKAPNYSIYPGQIIIIPPLTINLGRTSVNGYAYPFINLAVLRKTLPYLTYLSIFSYEVQQDGTLKNIDDSTLISEARAARVAPVMVITNLSEQGFDSDLAHKILNDQGTQDTLVNAIIATLKAKNYYGLDVDFENVYPYDRLSYNNFIKRLVNTLSPLGYKVSAALAPKSSATQTGILYEAHDYRALGALLDHVILMTYDWGFIYGPPMAVAPLNEVRKVLDYAVTEIPPKKILMGIPNYGYDWTLPFVEGTAAKLVTNAGAPGMAYSVGANIQFDPQSMAPFFNYYDNNGKQHVVWFEDARSILAKLTLAHEFNLGGVSYWTINQYFPQNWLVLGSVHQINKVI